VTTVFRIVRYLLEVNVGQQTVKEFTYDSAGRTTAVETSAGTTSLSYDYESRVTGITYPNQSTNSFTYNGLDTRVGMSDSGGSKSFLRDGVSVTSPVLSDGSATYTPAISERRSSTTTFYHAGIKNGDSQSSTGQSITASVQYDAFGNVTSSSGTWQGPFAYGGPYGCQSDPDSGLKLLGHRYYDPSTGRFLTRDPAKDGRNWYGYCENNPLRWADPRGTWLLSLMAHAAENNRKLDEDSQTIGGWLGFRAAWTSVFMFDRYMDRWDLIEIDKDGTERNRNTDCGLFVGQIAREYDPDFPARGTALQRNYLEGRGKKKWLKVLREGYTPRPGDIFNRTNSSGFGHTAIVGYGPGEGELTNIDASYGDHGPELGSGVAPFGGIFRPRRADMWGKL